MHKVLISFILLFGLTNMHLNAQSDEPVKWTYSVKKVSATEAILLFDAKIDPRWHLYSQNFPEGGPVRMSIKFVDSKDYKRVGKVIESTKPKIEHDDVFEMDVQYFEGRASLSQKIQLLSTKDIVVRGELEYQVCYDDKCILLNPEFEFEITSKNKI